jgi:hypothetical protein
MTKRAPLILAALLLTAIACAVPTTPSAPTEEGGVGAATTTPEAHGPTDAAPPTETSEPLPPASVDVSRIVYSDSGNVWALEEDGTTHQLTSDGGASDVFISDDGARVAYVWRSAPDAHGELRAVNADGSGGATVLLTAAQLDAFYPIGEGVVGTDISMIAFIPGTHRMVFNTYAIPEFIGFMRHDDLWIIDADTAGLTSLRPGGEGGDFFLAPDGSQMALITPTSVSMINTDGTNHRPDLITFPWVITYSEFLFTPLASWNPDSSMLVAVIPSEDPLVDTVSGSIWTIPADTGPASLMATIPGNFYFHFWRSPAVSPDLSWVAFTRRVGADDEDLILAHTDGTGEVVYATGEVDWAGWSPDSTHFAYRFGEPSGLMIGALGEAPLPVGPGTGLRWVNDTEHLYLAGSAGAWTLTRGSIGGSPEALVSPAGDFVSYDFTP